MGELARIAAAAFSRRRHLEDTLGILAESKRAMVVVDGDTGAIVEANDVAYELFGKPLAGVNINRLIPERYRQAHDEHRLAFMEHPAVRPVALRGLYTVMKDGSEVPAQVDLTPIPETRMVIAEVDQLGDPVSD